MVAGLYKRAHGRASSSSGWRFPSRSDTLALPKPQHHHIVHANMQEGINKLNDYLQSETNFNSGAATIQSEPHTPEHSSSLYSVAGAGNSRLLYTAQSKKASKHYPRYASTLEVDRHLQGRCNIQDKSPTASRGQKGSDVFALAETEARDEVFADIGCGHLISSPPLSGQETPGGGSRSEMASLGAQSPPLPPPDSPPLFFDEAAMDTLASAKPLTAKRARADIATPKKPGTEEARRQQDAEFIYTPARAPSAMKRQQLSVSPPKMLSDSNGSRSPAFTLASVSNLMSAGAEPARQPEPAVHVSQGGMDADASAIIAMYADSIADGYPNKTKDTNAHNSTTPSCEAPLQCTSDGDTIMLGNPATDMRHLDSGDEMADSRSGTTLSPSRPSTSGSLTQAFKGIGSSGLLPSEGYCAAAAEATAASMLKDTDPMNTASAPPPGTPASHVQQTPISSTANKQHTGFDIPADWLASPESVLREQWPEAAAIEAPLTQYSTLAEDDNSPIPVTPANQALLDSLSTQQVSPRRVPKFSQMDMEQQRKEYEERISRQNELREMLISSLKEEYAASLRAHEQQASSALEEAEEEFKRQLAERERELAAKLAAEQQRHQQDVSKHDEETLAQVSELGRESSKARAERDELRTMLDEYMAASTSLLEQKEEESNGLSRELGRLTLERQRLQEKLDEAKAHADSLVKERSEVQERLDLLAAENARLEELNSNLRSDILVAEERNTKIREHAENTLAKANAQVGSLHKQLAEAQKEAAALKSQATKADARARSLQIQLDSTKRQNEELLALCERLESSIM
ncbi:hypothetical protein GQ54DRAFT_339691 [Martensiomyces pterosporus]|nr:hypothetical protein GQ54DRAFT_339691 [Martensiomyces pterosporus]